jgi:hypothetical protein
MPSLPQPLPRTPLERWLEWFGSRSVHWLDTLLRSSGIHNFLSSKQFTPFERLFLANGLNFVCTPPSSHYHMFKHHYFEDSTRGLPRFTRALFNRVLFDQNTSHIPKFQVPSRRSPAALTQHLTDEHRGTELGPDLELLSRYTDNLSSMLRRVVDLEEHRTVIRQQRLNHSAADVSFIRSLMTDANITIKPADKNLGMVLVDTNWYNAELHRMLSDTVTYHPLSNRLPDHMKKRTSAPTTARSIATFFIRTPAPVTNTTTSLATSAEATIRLQKDLYAQLTALTKRHTPALEAWHSVHCAQVIKYLNRAVTPTTCTVPGIYLLVKVHKASGLCGRPIVPSTRWVTTPASQVVDHLLQEIVAKAGIEHIVKDTKSFVVELEHTILSARDGVFLTADIGSLYTNIDTKLGLRLVQEFLIEQHAAPMHVSLIMDLLTFVMDNSYLSFQDRVYHQVDGTAMGTSCAPIYANIIVYMLERPVIQTLRSAHLLHLYRRFLDDVLAYVDRSAVDELKFRLNSLHPKLKFDFISHSSEAAFLDLRIHKGERFEASGIFDLAVHQKKMNLYLYIPYNSFHTDAMKRGFIQTELMRYIRNSSNVKDYSRLKQVFYERLRARGYPAEFLRPLFDNIFYRDRQFFLWPSATLHEHPLLHSHPPRSACLLRRITRWKLCQSAHASNEPAPRAPVFVIPYSPLSRLIQTRSLLSRQWDMVRQATQQSLVLPIVAYQSQPSLSKQLVFQRSNRLEKARQAAATTATGSVAVASAIIRPPL